jgi:hypothetical protein
VGVFHCLQQQLWQKLPNVMVQGRVWQESGTGDRTFVSTAALIGAQRKLLTISRPRASIRDSTAPARPVNSS